MTPQSRDCDGASDVGVELHSREHLIDSSLEYWPTHAERLNDDCTITSIVVGSSLWKHIIRLPQPAKGLPLLYHGVCPEREVAVVAARASTDRQSGKIY